MKESDETQDADLQPRGASKPIRGRDRLRGLHWRRPRQEGS